jgi:hypothetical protein
MNTYFITIIFYIILKFNLIISCKKNTDCMKTCYMGQDLCYMQHTFPDESDEGFCDGGSFLKSGKCKKKKSLDQQQCKNDNNFCVTRLCNSNICKHRTGGCASFSDCVGAAVQGLGDYFQGETSEVVSEFVEKDSNTIVEDLKENCDTPTGGPHCPDQPCNGYGKLRRKNKKRRLNNLELIHKNTPGKLISRSIIKKINSNISHIERRELFDTLEKVKNLLANGLIIEKNVEICHYIVKKKQFIKPNKTCVPQDTSGYWFHRKVETNSCRDKECKASGDLKICIKGPVYFSITPNFKFDLKTFNFGIGAGFLFDSSNVKTTIISTGNIDCVMDRDWVLTSKYTLFKKPVKFGAVSILIEISGQITARIHGELHGTGSTEISISLEESEIADSFQLGLNMKKSEESCLNLQNGNDIPEPPNLFNRRSRILEEKKCNEARVNERLLMDNIINKKHRKLLEIKFKPKLNHIKSSAKTKAKLTAGIQGEFTLTINGVQAEVGIGGDITFVAEADGSTSSNDDTCIKASANIVGGIKIGTYIPSFDLIDTIANFGEQQCSTSLGLIDKLRRRRLNDNKKYNSIFNKNKISQFSNDTLKWLGDKKSKNWHMKVIRLNRKLKDRYGDACNSNHNNRKEIIANELKTDKGRKGICKTIIDFGLKIIGNPNICINEFSQCEVLYKINKIELKEINENCGSDGILTINDYTCVPFKTNIDEEYKSSCLYKFDWILFWKIFGIIFPILLCCCLGFWYYKKKHN